MIVTKSFSVKTAKHTQFVDITREIEKIVTEAKLSEGAAHVFTRHTTAAIAINENEAGLLDDYEALLEKLTPRSAGYAHDRIDDNAHAHLRAMLLGQSKTVPILHGRLALGTWQRVFLAEFDGPRSREVVVQVVG